MEFITIIKKLTWIVERIHSFKLHLYDYLKSKVLMELCAFCALAHCSQNVKDIFLVMIFFHKNDIPGFLRNNYFIYLIKAKAEIPF